MSHVVLNWSLSLFSARFEYLQKWRTYNAVWLLHGRCHMKLLPSLHMFSVHHTTMHHVTSEPCTMSCYLMQNYIRREYVCLAVTCHLHFWQSGWAFLRAATVTRELNGYRNTSQHREFTLEKKINKKIFRGFYQDSNPRPFDLTTEPPRSPSPLLPQ